MTSISPISSKILVMELPWKSLRNKAFPTNFLSNSIVQTPHFNFCLSCAWNHRQCFVEAHTKRLGWQGQRGRQMRGQTMPGAFILTRRSGEEWWALSKTCSCWKGEFEVYKQTSNRWLKEIFQQYRKIMISFWTKEVVVGKEGSRNTLELLKMIKSTGLGDGHVEGERIGDSETNLWILGTWVSPAEAENKGWWART